MKQENQIALKTLAIKARVYNQIRKEFYKKAIDKISEGEKVAFFNKLFTLNHEAHWELNIYKQKRKDKAVIEADRKARGVVPKKKTTKEEYLNSLKKAV